MDTLSPDQLLSAFNWRYATKAFDPTRKITDHDWQTLLEALRLSPSSFGLQPWHFLSISTPQIRETLLPHTWGQQQIIDCSHYLVLCTRTDIDVAFVEEFIASTAEIRGVTIESLQGYRDVVVDFITTMTQEERVAWCTRQTYLALQRLMDAAALLGLDTCPIEGFLAAEYNQVLDLTARDLTASVCCAVGYRSTEDKYAELPKSRYPLAKVFSEV